MDAHDMGERFAIGECEGKLLCVSSDMPAEALGGKAVSNLKKLSGRDTVSSAVKHDQKRKEFLFTGKIIMVTNNPLLLKQEDAAFRERIVMGRKDVPGECDALGNDGRVCYAGNSHMECEKEHRMSGGYGSYLMAYSTIHRPPFSRFRMF